MTFFDHAFAQGLAVEAIGMVVEVFVLVKLLDWWEQRRDEKRLAPLRQTFRRRIRRLVDRILSSLEGMARNRERLDDPTIEDKESAKKLYEKNVETLVEYADLTIDEVAKLAPSLGPMQEALGRLVRLIELEVVGQERSVSAANADKIRSIAKSLKAVADEVHQVILGRGIPRRNVAS